MTENERIQEMARTICDLNTDKGCFCDGGYCNYNCLAYEKAKTLYSKGYRKVERGEWEKKDDPILGAYYVCSSCKCEWFTDGLCSSENENNLNYCPNCGADMRKEQNDEKQ